MSRPIMKNIATAQECDKVRVASAEMIKTPLWLIERIGRDKEQAIERWNMRSNALGNRRAAFGASVLTDGLAGKRTEE